MMKVEKEVSCSLSATVVLGLQVSDGSAQLFVPPTDR